MQITGPGVWGEPRDPDEAIRVLRRAVELGVTFIDTADSYGPEVSERMICEALDPYPDDLVIATKAGLTRPGPGRWEVNGRPSTSRPGGEEPSPARRGANRAVSAAPHRSRGPPRRSVGRARRAAGRRQDRSHRALGGVGARGPSRTDITPIVTVQNRYNLLDRGAEPVLDYCQREDIGFIPWFPMATGRLAEPGGPLQRIADEHTATPAQLALAWLLQRQPFCCRSPAPRPSHTSKRT